MMKSWIYSIAIILMSQSTYSSTPCCPKNNVLHQHRCVSSDRTITSIQLACTYGAYMLEPEMEPSEAFNVDEDGRLQMINSTLFTEKDSFCVAETAYVNLSTIGDITSSKYPKYQVALVCFPESFEHESVLTHTVICALSIISVIFLCLTFAVYCIVPQMRDLQGKIIMCTCVCLALAFLHLTIAQNIEDTDSTICLPTAFGMYFWMIAAFFWMNIISINVMRTTIFPNQMISDQRMFLYYNIYGWGSPIILLIATLATHHSDGDHLKPGFGDRSCWFFEKSATWAYFYGPMAVLLALNIMLFIFTSIILCKKSISKYNTISKYRVMEYKFYLYVKLFIVTGLSWTFEVLSYAHDTKHFAWMLADIFNALQGLSFFLLLVVFRKRALRGLALRGFPIPCSSRFTDGVDEECDEIMNDEEIPSMTTARP